MKICNIFFVNNLIQGGVMRKSLLIVILLASVLLLAQTTKKTTGTTAAKHVAAAPTVLTPDKITWGDPPPVLAPGAKMAVLSGNPNGPGEFVVRLKMPDGYKIMPHWHPTQEDVTVISGEFRVAMGDKWDDSKLGALTPGSFAAVPARHRHYAQAHGDTEVQVNGMGPFKLYYVNPADNPSTKK
jgi:quercetin dioxygenase-like cupin family protein